MSMHAAETVGTLFPNPAPVTAMLLAKTPWFGLVLCPMPDSWFVFPKQTMNSKTRTNLSYPSLFGEKQIMNLRSDNTKPNHNWFPSRSRRGEVPKTAPACLLAHIKTIAYFIVMCEQGHSVSVHILQNHKESKVEP